MSEVTTKNNLMQIYTKQQAAEDSKIQLLETNNGVLATVMRDTLELEGYPFGSVVPFCLNERHEPVVLISDLAQHTKNINQNPKTSLTLHNIDKDNIQKGWRLTIVGDVHRTPPSERLFVEERYERFFAGSREYHKVHDFNFYTLTPKKLRYINGFGEIHWIDFNRVIEPTIFDAATELDMITHMNEDHHDALLLFLKPRLEVTAPEKVRIVQIDQYGFVVAHDEALFRFWFKEEAKSPNDIRLLLVDMVKEARKAA